MQQQMKQFRSAPNSRKSLESPFVSDMWNYYNNVNRDIHFMYQFINFKYGTFIG